MDERETLHNAARCYLMNREAALFGESQAAVKRESVLHLHRSFLEHAGLSERRDVVQGILRRTEGVDPGAYASIEALRAFLIETAEVASLEADTRPPKEPAGSLFGWPSLTEMANRAGRDERDRFRRHIEGLRSEEMHRIPRAPHRRLLGEREAERLWRRLQRKWQIPSRGYWWPLGSQATPPPHVLAFNTPEFDERVPPSHLREWIHRGRTRLVLVFDNDNPRQDYEMDVELFDPYGSEQYWTSQKMDWILYISHEASTTVGGEWLLNLVKRAWPEWAAHLRTTHIPPT